MHRTTKRVLTILTTTALVLSLTACGPSSGTVLDREYDDADTYTGRCGARQDRSCLKYDREHWRLELTDGEATGWRNVGREAYEACRVGDYYDAEQKTCRA